MRLILSQVGLPVSLAGLKLFKGFTGYSVVNTTNSSRAEGEKSKNCVRDSYMHFTVIPKFRQ